MKADSPSQMAQPKRPALISRKSPVETQEQLCRSQEGLSKEKDKVSSDRVLPPTLTGARPSAKSH